MWQGANKEKEAFATLGSTTMIKKELVFTFHSDGTYHSFNPFKQVYDTFAREKRHQLSMMRDLVVFRASPTVFILDNKGRYVDAK